MEKEIPYRAEYAKSGRSACKACKSLIEESALRIGVLVEYIKGRIPLWHHFDCFFAKYQPKTPTDIENYETLVSEDQKKIEDQIATGSLLIVDKNRRKMETRNDSKASTGYKIEYAKSDKSTCRGCGKKIEDEVRVSVEDPLMEIDRWYHLTCFAELRSELNYFDSADKLPGFNVLRKYDQFEALDQLPKWANQPYQAAYAKSGRSSCKDCKSLINENTLRMGALVESVHGIIPIWYHFNCFFKKYNPTTTDDIDRFKFLRVEEQKKIKNKIAPESPEGKGKKRSASDADSETEFRIEYAKSGRAICRECGGKIIKDQVRISVKNIESYGQDKWHHLTCFAKIRSELGYSESIEKMSGFSDLKKSDQKDVLKQF